MKKFLIVTFIFCTVIITTPIQTLASSANNSLTLNSRELTPKANVTGYKYRIKDGKRWKRLWSYTYNRWEEPNWTLIG